MTVTAVWGKKVFFFFYKKQKTAEIAISGINISDTVELCQWLPG